MNRSGDEPVAAMATETVAEKELEVLLAQIREGHDTGAFEKLCEKYAHLLDAMVKQYAPSLGITAAQGTSELLGIGRDELRQDAAMALYRAAMTYDPSSDKGQKVRFGLYAKICIRNAMITQIRRYERLRARREQQTKGPPRRDRREKWEALDPSALTGDTMVRLQTALSAYEKQILPLYLQGKPPREIATVLGRSERSISNGIYRIKCKLKELLQAPPTASGKTT